MSEYQMLYYPLVQPPERTILEAALYWDSLISFIPRESGYGEYILASDLALMRDEGLYTGVEWESAFRTNRDVMDSLAATLRGIIEDGGVERFPIPQELTQYTRLWSGKLPHFIELELVDRGVLARDRSQPGALRGDQHLLLAVLTIMSDLASVELMRRTGHHIVPTTDSNFAHHCTTAPISTAPVTTSWMVDVGALLPVPARDTPIEHVLDFRRRYGDERMRCMRAVRTLQTRLRSEVTDPRQLVSEMRSELEEAVSDMRAATRASSLDRWVKKPIWATVALGAAFMESAALISAPVSVALGTVVGGAAITFATSQARARDPKYSYLYRLDSEMPAQLWPR